MGLAVVGLPVFGGSLGSAVVTVGFNVNGPTVGLAVVGNGVSGNGISVLVEVGDSMGPVVVSSDTRWASIVTFVGEPDVGEAVDGGPAGRSVVNGALEGAWIV